ncbi:predicted protein [Postia placenta Mad-698-R]|nr:predicted protein [Postia placenta Mad-698-R]
MDVIHLAEESEVVQKVLEVCYPIKDPKLPSLEIAGAVLEAALKYDIDKVISCIPLGLHAFIPTEPLRVYALACRIDAEALARCAAKDVAIQELTSLHYVPELKNIPGVCYYRLVQYRARGIEQETFCRPSIPSPIPSTEDDDDVSALRTPPPRAAAATPHSPAFITSPTLDEVACTIDSLPPFDTADADVELVTSDGMHLRVYRSIISLISHALKDLLDVSEASASVDETGSLGVEPRKSMLVVPIVETSTIMQPLLRLCYPIGIPQQDDVELLISLLPSAEKYKMERAIWTIQSRWADFAVVQPLRAFLLAAARQWMQPAMDAIKQLLKHTIEELQSIYVADLETVPANYYRLVFQYHNRCSDAITSVCKSSLSWLSRDVRVTGCKGCRGPSGLWEEPRWLSDYVAKAVDMLVERPSSHTITEGQGFQTLIELATGKNHRASVEKPQTSFIPKAAPLPMLFNRSDADVILRAVDQVDFRTHRIILSMASPFFADMFALPQTKECASDVIDVIDLAEGSEIVQILLEICYPTQDPELSSMDIARAVLEAALKYDMYKVISFMSMALYTFIPTEPLRVYSIACRIDAERLARWAANSVTAQDITSQKYVDEFKDIPAGCYYRLVQYRMKGIKQHTYCCPSPPTSSVTEGSLTASRTSPAPAGAACAVDPSPPFDAADADIELVTSDGMRLRVYRSIISLISPVLKDLLDISESGANVGCSPEIASLTSDDHPRNPTLVLSIPENSTIMEPLLRLCYPIGIPQRDDAELLVSLLEGAEKYKMERAVWTIQSRWADFAVTQPLRAFLLSAARRWVEQAKLAARHLLRNTIEELQSIYIADLETTSAEYYHRLFQYHRRCSDAVRAVGNASDAWLSEDIRRIGCPGSSCCNSYSKYEPRWLSGYIFRAATLLIERPSSYTVTEGQGFREMFRLAADECSRCMTRIDVLQAMSQALGKAVDERLEQPLAEISTLHAQTWLSIIDFVYIDSVATRRTSSHLLWSIMAIRKNKNRASEAQPQTPSVPVPKPSPVPIFNRSDADVILRSADQVDFRAHRNILSMASPFFADLFTLPQSQATTDTSTALNVIDLAENSETIQTVLEICYPAESPKISSMDISSAVIEAALKYDIAKVVSFMTTILNSFIATDPLRVYAIACRIGAEDLAGQAAREVSLQDVSSLRYIDEFKGMSAGWYHRLIQGRLMGVSQGSYCRPVSCTPAAHGPPVAPATVSGQNSYPPPFDAAEADVEIVTSDRAHYRVQSSVISLMSPVLHDMVGTTSSTAGGYNGEPREQTKLAIMEDSSDFEPLLRLCYPAGIPEWDRIELLVSLLPVAEKYRMERAIWIIQWRWPEFAASQPLRAYLLASARRWWKPAKHAARNLFRHTIE